MMRRLLIWLSDRLPNPRIIFDRNGERPYLSRYYLVGSPRMADGSAPFDDAGRPREGIDWGKRRFGIYLHHFHRGDDEAELHNHPWEWSLALILAGGYVEERRGADDRVYRRWRLPGGINFIRGSDFHRVDLIQSDAWSLFIAGPKMSSWGFWNRDTGVFKHWKVFISELRDPTAFARERKAAN